MCVCVCVSDKALNSRPPLCQEHNRAEQCVYIPLRANELCTCVVHLPARPSDVVRMTL